MKRILVAILFVAAILPISFQFAQINQPNTDAESELLPGLQIQKELEGREIHRYRVHLESGKFNYCKVMQKGIDVVVRLYNPKGKQVVEMDTPIGDTGPEIIQFVNNHPGDYIIEIQPYDSSAKIGSYDLRLNVADSREDFQQQFLADFDQAFIETLEWANREMGKEILTYRQIRPGIIPREISIEATPHEWGYLLGLLSKKQHGPVKRTRTSANEAINRQIIAMYQSVYPQYLDIVNGACESFGLTMDDVDLRLMENQFFFGVWWFLFKCPEFNELMLFSANGQTSTDDCSIVSTNQKERGRQIVGRNFDLGVDVPRFVVHSHMEGVYESMGITGWTLNHWIMDGINEKGLFIGSNSNGGPAPFSEIGNRSYPTIPAIDHHHLKRLVLDLCSNVDEAVALIRKTHVWFRSDVSHYLIADKDGHSVVVEYDEGTHPLFYFDHDAPLVLTNTAYQSGPYFLMNFCWRFREAIDRLKTKIHNSDDMLSLMTAIRQKGSFPTLWTSIYDLSQGKMDVYFKGDNYAVPYSTILAYSDDEKMTMASETRVKTIVEKTQKLQFDAYVGKYKFNDFWFVNISKDGEQLFIQNTGIRKRKIVAETVSEFNLPEDDFKISFHSDSEGNVTHLDFFAYGIEFTAQKISDAPGDVHKSISKTSLIVSGILFSLLLIYFLIKFFVDRLKSVETRKNLKMNRKRCSRLSKIWICSTAFIFLSHIGILLFLNDLHFLEKLLNFGLYEPGVDEIFGSWLCFVSLIFSIAFIIVSWIKQYWNQFERILMTLATGVLFYFLIHMWHLGLLTL